MREREREVYMYMRAKTNRRDSLKSWKRVRSTYREMNAEREREREREYKREREREREVYIERCINKEIEW